eukprot:50458_1
MSVTDSIIKSEEQKVDDDDDDKEHDVKNGNHYAQKYQTLFEKNRKYFRLKQYISSSIIPKYKSNKYISNVTEPHKQHQHAVSLLQKQKQKQLKSNLYKSPKTTTQHKRANTIKTTISTSNKTTKTRKSNPIRCLTPHLALWEEQKHQMLTCLIKTTANIRKNMSMVELKASDKDNRCISTDKIIWQIPQLNIRLTHDIMSIEIYLLHPDFDVNESKSTG